MILKPEESGKENKMESFQIRCANLTVQLNTEYEYAKKACSKYIVHGFEPDFELNPSKKEIQEIADFLKTESLEYIEFMSLFHTFAREVLKHNAVVLHSVALSLDEEGYVFAAPSGIGKTTHASLWKKTFGDRCTIINGDKPLITFSDGKFYISGTPWCGKERMSENKTVPLKKVCFIERAEQNSISKIQTGEIIQRLFNQLAIPMVGEPTMPFFLSFADKMVKNLPFYLLKCNKEDEAALVAYEGMNKE